MSGLWRVMWRRWSIRVQRGPRYRELREGWHGRYDPNAFDLTETNVELAKLAPTDTQ
jgi:hypothetical protein